MATLSPTSPSAFLGIKHVEASLKSRPYRHYIQVVVKESARGAVSYSHLNITTDAVKADTDGYYTPQDWLNQQSRK